MKKLLLLLLLTLITGCHNEKKLDCTLSLEVNDFKETWKFSFVFEKDILQSYSNFNTNLEIHFPKSLQIPVKVTNPNNLKVGDVVAFQEKDSKSIIVHRIIDIVEKDGVVYFVTKGDDNTTQDKDLLSLDDVLFQSVGSINDWNEKTYEYVKDYFEQKGYSCK